MILGFYKDKRLSVAGEGRRAQKLKVISGRARGPEIATTQVNSGGHDSLFVTPAPESRARESGAMGLAGRTISASSGSQTVRRKRD